MIKVLNVTEKTSRLLGIGDRKGFLFILFYLFLERGESKGERERNIDVWETH